ncbi:MAG: Spy/CpxP family protein refolding chaperone [Candidatus Omnitrophica bacterium]|nr:Spy/CpxP family protein refolding chaperone [Candidatus Omnitrophota bacterium]
MNMPLTKIAVAVLVVLLAGTPTFVCAQPGDKEQTAEYRKECPGKEEWAQRHQKIMEELGLSPEQQVLIKEQHEALRGKQKEMRQAIQEKRKALRELLGSPEVNPAAANNLIDEITTLMNQQMRDRVDAILSMKDILTDEQFQKLQELHKERKEHWKRHNGPGHHMKGDFGDQFEGGPPL